MINQVILKYVGSVYRNSTILVDKLLFFDKFQSLDLALAVTEWGQ